MIFPKHLEFYKTKLSNCLILKKEKEIREKDITTNTNNKFKYREGN